VDRLLTVQDVADMLRTTPTGVRRLRERGTLPPAVKVGARVLWREEELAAWLEARRER
jgi:excisionase family DNA binding protein